LIMNILRTTLLVGLSLAEEPAKTPAKTLPKLDDVSWTHPDKSKDYYRPYAKEPIILDSTVCQNFVGYQFYDFKNLDIHMRDVHKTKPSIIHSSHGDFAFKLCQDSWSLKVRDTNTDKLTYPYMKLESEEDTENCGKPRQAYLDDGLVTS